MTKYTSKGGHDVKVAAADTPRTLTGVCAAGVGVVMRIRTVIVSEGEDEDEYMSLDLAELQRTP